MKSLGKFPDAFIAEISSQPAALRRAADALHDQRAALERIATARGGLIGLTGMGSSFDAAFPIACALASAGVVAIHVEASELLHVRAGIVPRLSALVLVSQSGESAEVVRVAGSLPASRSTMLVAVTNGVVNPLAAAADVRLDTRAGAEDGPSTMTFVTAVAVLGAIGLVLAGREPDEALDRLDVVVEDAAGAIEAMLAHARAVEETAGSFAGRYVAVLGRGPARAAAEMGALTLKESGVVAEAFETASFRHGPIELAGPDMAAIVVATEPATNRLDVALGRELADAGAEVVVIATDDVGDLDRVSVISVPTIDPLLSAVVSIVPIQLLARALASGLGREPGRYLRATKVTARE